MHATSTEERTAIAEMKDQGLHWLAILAGSAIMALGYYFIYNEVRPAEGEYVAGYVVAFLGLILPAFVAGVVTGLIAKRSPAVHAAAAVVVLVVGGVVVRLVALLPFVAETDLQLSILTVFGVAWGFAAPLGGSVVGVRQYRLQREAEAAAPLEWLRR